MENPTDTQLVQSDQQGQTDISAPIGKGGEFSSTARAIGNADQVLQIGRRFQREDRPRDELRAETFAAWGGESPYDPKELEAEGRSWEFNLSFGFMEGVVPRAQAPLLELGIDEDYLLKLDGELIQNKLDIIRRGTVRQVKAWGGWPNFFDLLTQEVILFGFCNAIFPDTYTPWPTFVAQQDGLVHRMAANNVENLDIFVWRQKYLMFQLYEKIANEQAAKLAGWNITNARAAIMGATPSVNRPGTDNRWLDYEKQVRDNGYYMSVQAGSKEIEVFHGLVREITGSVSHWIACGTPSITPKKTTENTDPAQLFKKFDKFKRMGDCLVYFGLEAGDGLWHGSKGIAQRCYNIHAALDRIRCNLLNQAFLSGLIPAKVQSQEAQHKMNLSFGGGFCFFPPDVELSAQKFPTISKEYFQVDSLMVAAANERFGDVVPDARGQYAPEKTATQSQIDQVNKQVINRATVGRFIRSYSQMCSIMVRRLCMPGTIDEDAKEFQAWVKSKGITDQDLAMISGARSFGQLSDVMGESRPATQAALSELSGSPYVDQRWLQKRRMTALLGPKEADEGMPPSEDQNRMAKERRIQYEEITSIMAGQPIEVMPDDLHEAHLEAGTGWMEQAIQGKITATIEQITKVGEHMGPHLEFLSQDGTKRELAEQFKQKLTQMAQILDQIEAKATAAQGKIIKMAGQPPPGAAPSAPAQPVEEVPALA